MLCRLFLIGTPTLIVFGTVNINTVYAARLPTSATGDRALIPCVRSPMRTTALLATRLACDLQPTLAYMLRLVVTTAVHTVRAAMLLTNTTCNAARRPLAEVPPDTAEVGFVLICHLLNCSYRCVLHCSRTWSLSNEQYSFGSVRPLSAS